MPGFSNGPLMIAGAWVLYHLLRYLVVVVHEMGHAIAAVVLTGENVTVYIGSYGDPRKSLKIRSRWGDMYFLRNPFRLRGGVCTRQASGTWGREMVIILAGVLCSAGFGIMVCSTVHALGLPGWVKSASVLLLGVALLDMITNLYPSKRPVQLYSGHITYRDGYKALLLLRNRDYHAEWIVASEYYSRNEYGDAARIFEDLLGRGMRSRELYHNAIHSYEAVNQLQKARKLLDDLGNECEMNASDFALSGVINAKLERYEEGLADYEKCLLIQPADGDTLNNRGYTLNLMGRYPEAIEDFDKAIALDHDSAYALSNRGLAKMKLGREEEGLADIRSSLAVDEKNSYAYRNLGIYHFDREEFQQALDLFVKARELDPRTHLIDQYIDRARHGTGDSQAADNN